MERAAFSVTEFCQTYRVGRDRFYGEVRKGRLRAIKLGKRTLILKTDAESWASALPALDLTA
jgi:excisionase family DNA binding protein